MQEGKVIDRMEINDNQIIFRYPRWRDLPQYIKMHNAFYKEKTMTYPNKLDQSSGCRKLAGVLTEVELKQANWLFMEIDGKLHGEGFARQRGANYAVVGLALMKESRGMGLGEAMMLLLENEARKLKRYCLYLEVWAANKPAISLYNKLGYKETGRKKNFIEISPGKFTDLIEMAKKIKKKGFK